MAWEWLDDWKHRRAAEIPLPDPRYHPAYAEFQSIITARIREGEPERILEVLRALRVELEYAEWLNDVEMLSETGRYVRRLWRAHDECEETLQRLGALEALHEQTDQESIRIAIETISEELVKHLARHPTALYHLKPRQFEELVAEVLSSFGWAVELTPETRDNGFDIFAVSRDRASGVRTSYIVECKKWAAANKVGVDIVRQLLWVKTQTTASHAILATTSFFTRGVNKIKNERYDFTAMDFDEVVRWCRSYRDRGSS